ncbi:MAG: septum site-determining protein MinC, partial [Candidatus Promineifilaceae bacterium]|nr:septum site-determining protein MinC [Candidatus Promineifilaceae bacterium]
MIHMETSAPTEIGIKGIREGILVTLDEAFDHAPFETVLARLAAELGDRRGFLQGSRVVLEVGYQPLSRSQLRQIQTLLTEHQMELWTVLSELEATREAARALDLATRLPGSNTDLEGNLRPEDGAVTAQRPVQDQLPPPAILLRETLRSGRSVTHEGHVVILGDVNPGAEVIATGNVVVWGRLRGMVHAGAAGDEEAIICALELAPTQLRIGN